MENEIEIIVDNIKVIEDSKDGKNQNLNSLEDKNDEKNEINNIIFDSNYNRNWLKYNNYSSIFLLYAFVFLIYSKI